MSHRVTKERIDKFRQDRRLLPYDDIVIADRMKKDRSNYSKSVNDGPITNGFLEKFYTAFGDELKEIEEKEREFTPVYTRSISWDEMMSELNSRIGTLTDEYQRLAENNQTLSQSNKIMAETTHLLAQNNQKLVEAHISILDRLKSSGSPPPP